MTDFYSTVEDVLEDTGLEPEDLGFEDDDSSDGNEKLEVKIIKWLVEAKSIIDNNRKRNFTAELADGTITEIPICIHDAAKRIAINKAKQARINRDSSIVSKDDYTIQITNDTILTTSILRDLESCSPIKAVSSFGMLRVNTSSYPGDSDESN